MQPTEEQVLQAYNRAPKAIQDALSDGPAVDFMVGLQARYSLHIDVAGKVVGRIRNLLLGLSNPTEFLGELIQLGISDTVARSLVGDLNKEVFVPLREEMQKVPQDTTPAPEPVTVPQRSLGAEKPLPAPTLAYEPAVQTLPGSPVAVPMPVSAPVAESTPPPQPVPQVVHPMHNQAPDGWHSAAAVHIYVPSHGAPYPAPAPHRIIDAVSEPTPSMPAEEPIPAAPIIQTTQQAPTPTPTPTPTPLKKDYAADPYREPIL